MTITTARALLFAVLLAATTRSSHAFQLAHKNSPLRLHATNNRKVFAALPANHNNLNLLDLHQSSSSAARLGRSAAIATMLHASSNINTDDDATKDITEANTTAENNKNLASSMKQFLSTHFLSLAIFLLPLFLFANDAWAVQSGGRMGGSFSGSSSSGSSSRTYSAPSSSGSYGGGYSRGYNRGYSSGYYSRPSVVVSPGISPFYR